MLAPAVQLEQSRALAARPPHLRTADAIRRDIRCPVLPRGITVALIRRPTNWIERPVAYGSLDDLARALLRDAQGSALQLVEAPLKLRHEDALRQGVLVYRLGLEGDQEDLLGWAYLAGCGRTVLAAAIFAVRPIPTEA